MRRTARGTTLLISNGMTVRARQCRLREQAVACESSAACALVCLVSLPGADLSVRVDVDRFDQLGDLDIIRFLLHTHARTRVEASDAQARASGRAREGRRRRGGQASGVVSRG